MREGRGRNEQALKTYKRSEAGKGSKRGAEYVGPFLERAYTSINMPERTELL